MSKARPWVANVGEGAAEHCPKVGCVPHPEFAGDAWHDLVNDLPTVVVSITEPGRKAKLPKGWHDMLRLQFQDYDPRHGGHVGPANAVLFTPTMAARLARFARKHRGCNVLVHCAAGISRSGAVAEALLQAFPEYEDRGWRRLPNGLVLTLLKRALGLVPIGYEEPRPSVSKRYGIKWDEDGASGEPDAERTRRAGR